MIGYRLAILEEFVKKPKGYEIAAGMYIRQLMLTLLRGDHRGLLRAFDGFDTEMIRQVIDYVDEYMSEGSTWGKSVSSLEGVTLISRDILKAMGVSFTNYVNIRRIRKAELLLATSDRSVIDIACSVGIHNIPHFYDCSSGITAVRLRNTCNV
ncbi:MAG: hypothetical protein K0Q94_4786 [Paenibacillus sp.]|jgi:transcriptional regulator GlxA family with amidase domain|uniref:helix-turn-helix domain-containing protein n=1 Tax=Paenibacillus sp. GCM10012303 TaxID=3317340 RepID=UPI0029F1D47E|nr:hypothetical protein [Paenibacillus sp.]